MVRWIEEGKAGLPLGTRADEVPFTSASVEAIARRLVPATCSRARSHAHKAKSVEPKTVSNAITVCRFVLRRFGLDERQTWTPLTPEWAALAALIDCPFERMQSKRLLCFFSAQGIGASEVSVEAVAPFISAVERDVRVADADLACRRALRVWRKLAKRHADVWPQLDLRMPRRRVIWGKRWPEMPLLEAAVDTFFAPPLPGRLFKTRRKKKLRPSTVRTQKEAIRCYVSALINDGVRVEELTELRSICTPEAFERGVALLEARAGATNHWVEKAARVVLKIAKYGDVLTEEEIEKVKKLYQEVSLAYAEWKKDRPDRDQELLDKLDDERLMDALIALPTKTVRKALAKGKITLGVAYSIQRAVILELWFCSAFRNINLLGLHKRHFRRVTIDGVERTIVSVPAAETKNGEATEHFLLEDVAELLDLYLDKCLPLIANGSTDFLFPGKKGPSKHQQTLRVQMENYIFRNLKLEGFHPHAIRKIVVKIALDEDPTAIEVVRRIGGWKGEKTLRRAYLQKRHRASQARWVEMLEARRLRAFSQGANARRSRNAA